jgi:cell division protein ZapA
MKSNESWTSKKESDRQAYDLNIAGMSFKLRSSHDEAVVKELVQFVDEKMKQALQALKSGSFQSAAVLAALNIAEELILLKKKAHHELDLLEERALKLSQNLENSKDSKAGNRSSTITAKGRTGHA